MARPRSELPTPTQREAALTSAWSVVVAAMLLVLLLLLCFFYDLWLRHILDTCSGRIEVTISI